MTTTISELQAIRQIITKYADGITNGDIGLLRSAFHPKAMMYGCSGADVTIIEIEGLFAYAASQEAPVKTGEQHGCLINKIDVAGNAASAEVIQEGCYGVNYTNYFHLLKIEGEWLIVSKTYNASFGNQSSVNNSSRQKEDVTL